MLVGQEKILAWYRQNKSPYWSLLASKNGERISASSDAPNLSLTEGEEQLTNLFDALQKGRYYLICKSDGTKTTKVGLYSINIELTGTVEAIGTPVHQTSTFTEEDINAKAKTLFDEYLAKQKQLDEIKQLKEEVRNLRPTAFGKVATEFMGAVRPYVPGIMDKLGIAKATPSIGSVKQVQQKSQPTKPSTEMANEELTELGQIERDKIDEALQIMMNHADADFLLLVARSVQDDPSLIEKVKVMLS